MAGVQPGLLVFGNAIGYMTSMEGLTEIVAEKAAQVFGPGTRVTGLEALAGDASSRRYFRAKLEGAGAPESAMAMSWSELGLPVSSEELAVFDEPPEELPFLNVHRFLQGVGVRVPAVYGHWVDEGLMLLEDLGDVSLWDRVREAPEAEVVEWYRKAIDELVVLQVQGTRARDHRCMAFRQAFDQRLYIWELAHFTEYGLEQGAKGSLPEAERRMLDALSGHTQNEPGKAIFTGPVSANTSPSN